MEGEGYSWLLLLLSLMRHACRRAGVHQGSGAIMYSYSGLIVLPVGFPTAPSHCLASMYQQHSSAVVRLLAPLPCALMSTSLTLQQTLGLPM